MSGETEYTPHEKYVSNNPPSHMTNRQQQQAHTCYEMDLDSLVTALTTENGALLASDKDGVVSIKFTVSEQEFALLADVLLNRRSQLTEGLADDEEFNRRQAEMRICGPTGGKIDR